MRGKIQGLQKYLQRNLAALQLPCSFARVPFILAEFHGSRGPAHVNAAAGLSLSDGEFVYTPNVAQHSPTTTEEDDVGKT